MLPDFPISKALSSTYITSIIKIAMKQHCGPYFNDIPEKQIYEGDGFISQYSETLSHETDLKKIAGTSDFNKDELLNNKNLVIEKLFEIGQQMAEQQMKMMFDTISSVTEKVGNVVQSNKEMTPEDIFNVYSKITIDLNADGTPRLPTIVTGTEMHNKMKAVLDQIFNDEALKKRFEEIINTQKQNWHDRENNRKLVG